MTKIDRLNLINQYKILSLLTNNEEKKEEYKVSIIALERGFPNEIEHLFERIKDEPEEYGKKVSSLEYNLLNHVLFMYENLLAMFYNNKEEYISHGITEKDVSFPGLRLHIDEGKLEDYLKFLIYDTNRFPLVAKSEYTTLSAELRMIDKYKRMLDIWNGMTDGGKKKITSSQLKQLLSAQPSTWKLYASYNYDKFLK